MALWGLSQMEFKETDIVLEVGFGGGVIIDHLAKEKYGKKLYGIDISERSVQKAKKRNGKWIDEGLVELYQGSVNTIPFLKEKFHKILAIQTHIYWDEFEQSLKGIFNSLKENGEFHIICEKEKIRYHLPKYLRKEDMITCFKQSGFQEIKIYEKNGWIHYQSEKKSE